MTMPATKVDHSDRAARRGSWRARKAANEAKRQAPLRLASTPTRVRRPSAIERVCRAGIPGYDPWRDCEGYTFDAKLARDRIGWIESNLTHVIGQCAGEFIRMEPWQVAVFANLFGWLDRDGWRRYRTLFLYVPRGNGKSPMASWLLLAMLFCDREPGAEIFGAASEYQQAAIVFRHAAGAVAANADLNDRVRIYRGQQKGIQLVQHPENIDDLSTYRLLSANAASAHGQQPHAFVLDELHMQGSRDLVDANATAQAKRNRRQPLTAYLTTADYEHEGSVCNELHDQAKRVCEGTEPLPRFLPVIYEAERDADWTSPETWRRANPNWGVSVDPDSIAAMCAEAQRNPRQENRFRRFHLNQRTEQAERWIPLDRWDACAGDPITLDDYKGRECWAGLDLAATRDLTALVMCFPEDDGTLALIPIFWIPKDRASERERKDRVPYLTWIREGWIRTTEGDTCDYHTIRRDINALAKEHRIRFKEIAIDRLFQGDQLGQELSEQDGFNLIAHGQGFLSMAAPTARFEELVLDGSIHHGANPVLRWHASNVSVELDAAGNMKPSRKKSSEKIDGIVAAIMAVGRTVSRSQSRSIYETQGLQFV